MRVARSAGRGRRRRAQTEGVGAVGKRELEAGSRKFVAGELSPERAAGLLHRA
jgi:hypothetical protein